MTFERSPEQLHRFLNKCLFWYSKSNSFMVSLHFGCDFFLMLIFVQLHKQQESTQKSKKNMCFSHLEKKNKKHLPQTTTFHPATSGVASCAPTKTTWICSQETPERSIRVASPWRWWPIFIPIHWGSPVGILLLLHTELISSWGFSTWMLQFHHVHFLWE